MFAAIALVASAQAHICIIHPHQRGSMNISDAGDHSCFRRTPSCGGMPAGAPTATYEVQKPAHIHFQQNLNHWSQDKPGHLDIAVSYDNEATWQTHKTFGDFPAHDMVTQTNFSINIVFDKPSDHAVLRVRYVSYNKDEVYPANNTDAIFYQCADIKIAASNKPEDLGEDEPSLLQGQAGGACRTPPQWTGTSESNLERTKIWYDASGPLVRWDHTNLKTGVTASFVSNYTATKEGFLEYGIWDTTKTCKIYGADTFYPWTYETVGSVVCKDQGSHIACQDMTNGFTWSAVKIPGSDNLCLPATWKKQEEQIVYHAEEAKAIDSSVFAIPSYCAMANVQKISCHSKN